VRSLQRRYLDVWVDVTAQLHPHLSRRTIGSAVQAAIGLVNSTPYLDREAASDLRPVLRSMALAAIGALGAAVR
jgi:hypothetical protein